MPVGGWFDGLTSRQAEAGAAAYLRDGQGLIVEWWGLVEVPPGDHDMAFRIEIGGRALDDARRENAPNPREREDWVVTKAVGASPLLFSELVVQDPDEPPGPPPRDQRSA